MPGLDGLRGLAVLGVMTNHFLSLSEGYGLFRHPAEPLLKWLVALQYSGWLGVDLFFALSGFLISGILVDSREQPHYFRNFYVRRALRIIPAYYLLLAVWFVTEGLFSPGNRGALNPQYPVWLWTYATNFLIVRDGWLSLPVPLRPLWSLAVEEQFYLLWPVAIYCLDRKKVIALCAVLIVLCPILRQFLGSAYPPLTADYVLMPSRMDSLAAGALMAMLWRESRDIARLLRMARGAALAALVAIIVMFVLHEGLRNDHPFDRSWGLTIFAVCFSCLVLLAAAGGGSSSMARLLKAPVLGWFGRYSYGLYLWHQPACLFLCSTPLMTLLARTYSPHSMWLLIVLLYAAPLLLSIALALTSWHLCEQPFLRLKDRFEAVPSTAPGAVTL